MNREGEEEETAADVGEQATSKKIRHKRKGKSEAWAHYHQTDEGPECKYCGQGFSTTTATGTLMNHVKRKHEDEDAVVENRKTADFSKGHADVLVGKLVANKCLPMSLVEDEDFLELVGYLRSGYKSPKRHKLTKVMLPAAKARLVVVMKRKMRSIGHFSLTLDAWTSAANRSYIAVTLHGVTAMWVLESFVIDVVPVKCSETAEFLGEVVKEVLQAWDVDIKRVVAVRRMALPT